MTRAAPVRTVAQAWIALRSTDPEAVSAFAVARTRLAAGRGLESLRRLRLIEIAGALPDREAFESLLHRSIQFYNPHKEHATVRFTAADPPPLEPGEVGVLVRDRDGDRRGAAERWWLHQTGEAVEVREGVVWALQFGDVSDPLEGAEALARLIDRHQGLLCNPHAQSMDVAAGTIPLPWHDPDARGDARRDDPGRAR